MFEANEKNKTSKEAATASFDAQKPLAPSVETHEMVDTNTGKVVTTENLMPAHLEDDTILDGIFKMAMKKSAEGTLQELTSDYLNFDDFSDGEKRPFIFLGMTEFKNPETGEAQEAVRLMSEERKTYITGSVILVNALKKVDKIPCGVVILKDKKTAGKKYHNVRVFFLG